MTGPPRSDRHPKVDGFTTSPGPRVVCEVASRHHDRMRCFLGVHRTVEVADLRLADGPSPGEALALDDGELAILLREKVDAVVALTTDMAN